MRLGQGQFSEGSRADALGQPMNQTQISSHQRQPQVVRERGMQRIIKSQSRLAGQTNCRHDQVCGGHNQIQLQRMQLLDGRRGIMRTKGPIVQQGVRCFVDQQVWGRETEAPFAITLQERMRCGAVWFIQEPFDGDRRVDDVHRLALAETAQDGDRIPTGGRFASQTGDDFHGLGDAAAITHTVTEQSFHDRFHGAPPVGTATITQPSHSVNVDGVEVAVFKRQVEVR